MNQDSKTSMSNLSTNSSSSPLADDLDNPQPTQSPAAKPIPESMTKLSIEPKKEPIMDITQIKSSLHYRKKGQRWLKSLIVIILLLALSITLIWLTESGTINIGLDHLYAKTVLPDLLGGISADSKIAIGKSIEATDKIKAFDFQADDGNQKSSGTVFKNNNFQFSYGSTPVIEYRAIDDEIFYTQTPNQWTKLIPNNEQLFDFWLLFFYINPYKILEAAEQHLREENFREQITSDKISIFRIYFELPDSEEKIQEKLDSLKLDQSINPLDIIGQGQIRLFIDNDYLLKRAEIELGNYSSEPIVVKFTISNKTTIEEPTVKQSSELDKAIQDSQKQARDARRRANLQSIAKALRLYAQDHNDLVPQTTLTEPSRDPAPTLAEAEKAEILSLSVSGNVVEKIIVPDYLSTFPKDPSDKYYYSYISTGYRFRLYAVSEAATDENCPEKFSKYCFISISQ